jgi:hypothetical protein
MEPTNTNNANTGVGQTATGQNLSPDTRNNQAQSQTANRGQTQGGASLSGQQNQSTQSGNRNST